MPPTPSPVFVALAALAMLLAGCAAVVEPNRWERDVGIIEYGGSSAPIQLPAEARRGQPFRVAVLTFGSSSCTRADGAAVEIGVLAAEITPHDRYADGAIACTDDLAPFSREVTLRFDQAGEARIRVVGRALLGGPALYETVLPVLP